MVYLVYSTTLLSPLWRVRHVVTAIQIVVHVTFQLQFSV